MTEREFRLENLPELSRDLLAAAGSRRVWTFYGEMGAGKTTTIKALCAELGVVDAMSSPSFAIVNEYATASGGSVYHMDCYRLNDESEAQEIGIEDYFYSGNFCFIEWPERIPGLLPDSQLKIYIKLVNELTRSVSLELT